MEGFSRKEEGCLNFLDLNSRERKWVASSSEEKVLGGFSEEKKLELRLGPPGEDYEPLCPFGQFSDNLSARKRGFKSPWQHQAASQFLDRQSQPCSNRVAGEMKVPESKTFSAAPAHTAVPNSQKRTASGPVVGWPPIRSFRKNLASGSSSKLASDSDNSANNKDSDSKPKQNHPKNLFVKINMDGIPIGRKVDLEAYDSYEKLSLAVDELFQGLLAAQSDHCDKEGGREIGGLLDGNREYTLVYEDNEGDRMLVGDVPWNMFVSTVKRLRALKSSELPAWSRGSKLTKKLPLGATLQN